MDPRASRIIEKIRELERELEEELVRRRDELNIHIQGRKVQFEQAMLDQHRRLKVGVMRYIATSRPLILLTAPVIYTLIVPFVLLDLMTSLYQRICFPVYRIARVRRADYMQYDRSQLAYLNLIEKLNCAYCAYANGVIAYVREVAARTEQYWCPIKHAHRVHDAHARYGKFTDFGDAEAYLTELSRIRQALEQGPDGKSKDEAPR